MAEKQAYERKLAELEIRVAQLQAAEEQKKLDAEHAQSTSWFDGLVHSIEEMAGIDLDGDGVVGTPAAPRATLQYTEPSPRHPIFDPAYHRSPDSNATSELTAPQHRAPRSAFAAAAMPATAMPIVTSPPLQQVAQQHEVAHEVGYSQVAPISPATATNDATIRPITFSRSPGSIQVHSGSPGGRHSCSKVDQEMMAGLALQAAQVAVSLSLGTPQPKQRQSRQIFEEELAQYDGGRPRPTKRPEAAPQYAPALPFAYTNGGVRGAPPPPVVRADAHASIRAQVARIQAKHPPLQSNVAAHMPAPDPRHTPQAAMAYSDAPPQAHQMAATRAPPELRDELPSGSGARTHAHDHEGPADLHRVDRDGADTDAPLGKSAVGLLKNLWDDLMR